MCKKIEGGVTAAKGFFAAGIYAGIKNVKKDMALIYSEVPAVAAATFTTNVVKAAPVLWDQELLKEGNLIHAVILNSGVANACTGAEGKEANEVMAKAVAEAMQIPVRSVFTASTGVIGKQLPMDVILPGVKKLKEALTADRDGASFAAEAIMTTDTTKKEYAVSFQIGGKEVKIGGMSKGSGMIHPNMATMLAVVTTDVAISKELLQEAVSEDVKDSYNMISVDRDTSTNDSLFVLANGQAENITITEKNEDYHTFCKALREVNQELAKKMAADGEGATKLFEVLVTGTKKKEEAAMLAKSVITSNLVKTAVFGNDANWGRILCAMGYSGVMFDPEKVELSIQSEAGKLVLVKDGIATDYLEETATKILSGTKVTAVVTLTEGEESATAWGCDLSYDYVKINGDYRS